MTDTLQVAASLSSGPDWVSFFATVIAALLGAVGIFAGVAYAQHRQLKNLLAAQRNEKVLERELDAVQDAYINVVEFSSGWTTRSVRESFDLMQTFQLNIRHSRFYLPEEFVKHWRTVYIHVASLDGLEEHGGPQTVKEQRQLKQDIPAGLTECRRILLQSQGRPMDKLDF